MDLTRALAARLGIRVQPVEYATPGEVGEGLNAGSCDIAFLVIDESRAAAVDFSPPYASREFTYLVPAGSKIRIVTDADQPGVRIGVVRTHASETALIHSVKQAELIRTQVLDDAIDLLRNGRVDAASARQDLTKYSARLPESRALEDHYGSSFAAIAVPKGNAGRLAYISEFLEAAKASGLVQRRWIAPLKAVCERHQGSAKSTSRVREAYLGQDDAKLAGVACGGKRFVGCDRHAGAGAFRFDCGGG